MAAHLHDSVLQTLALIQRAREPREMTMLARTQERELRAWLYGRAHCVPGVRLRDALDATAGRIERSHAVKVETVTVGDAPMDERLRTGGGHQRSDPERRQPFRRAGYRSTWRRWADAVTAFVRDHGSGFDLATVPADRRGIADSIVARMQRHGGTAEVVSGEDGTEVRLTARRGVAGRGVMGVMTVRVFVVDDHSSSARVSVGAARRLRDRR